MSADTFPPNNYFHENINEEIDKRISIFID